eukprot:TRINITY_DN2403_c0_g5_i2.p1 TRINITY_DN2403_c0_g5~~TRINITY_DN2403_c0_g5_i2.p1  ORF type:complete len:641 (+),score=115.78 TRINITY_DN2403_c0_g5_i2:2419-4341(+)
MSTRNERLSATAALSPVVPDALAKLVPHPSAPPAAVHSSEPAAWNENGPHPHTSLVRSASTAAFDHVVAASPVMVRSQIYSRTISADGRLPHGPGIPLSPPGSSQNLPSLAHQMPHAALPPRDPHHAPRDSHHHHSTHSLVTSSSSSGSFSEGTSPGYSPPMSPSPTLHLRHTPQLLPVHHQHDLAGLPERLSSNHVDMASFLTVNSAQVASQLLHDYQETRSQIKKPAVLLAGATGSGKSALVNAVFGSCIAQVGVGAPLTQYFTRFDDDRRPIALFDAKGLECGEDLDRSILDIKDFIQRHSPTSEKPIHVLWYVINSATSRFQPFEARILKELFCDIPLVILLNKADCSTDADRKKLHQVIEELNLPNLRGIFDTIAEVSKAPLPTVQRCPRCGDEEGISIKKRTRQLICEACQFTTILTANTGLEEVVKATVEVLDIHIALGFIAAQRVSCSLKAERSCKLIKELHSQIDHCRTPASLSKCVAKTLSQLSIVWDFCYSPSASAEAMANDVCGDVSLSDRLVLLVNQSKELRLEAVALAIMWTEAIRKMTFILVQESLTSSVHSVAPSAVQSPNSTQVSSPTACTAEIAPTTHPAEPAALVEKAVEHAWDNFSEATMRSLLAEIMTSGLDAVLTRHI